MTLVAHLNQQLLHLQEDEEQQERFALTVASYNPENTQTCHY